MALSDWKVVSLLNLVMPLSYHRAMACGRGNAIFGIDHDEAVFSSLVVVVGGIVFVDDHEVVVVSVLFESAMSDWY